MMDVMDMQDKGCKVRKTQLLVQDFLAKEQYCSICRRSFNEISDLLDRISEGTASPGAVKMINELAVTVLNMCQCNKGKPVAATVIDYLNTYKEDFQVHLENHVCPDAQCPKLVPAPCQAACPAGISIPNYISLVGMGKYSQALKLIREDVPLPGSLGRICEHPCEKACRRAAVDKPISICALKRLAFDKSANDAIEPSTPVERKYREIVAVVGAGPAGLACAYFMARRGYGVTVFEAMPEPGGMLAYGIPSYRLPRQVLRDEIDRIRNMGVKIKLNTRISGENGIRKLQQHGYASIFLGPGAWKGAMPLSNPEGLSGVMDGITFLSMVNLQLNSINNLQETGDCTGQNHNHRPGVMNLAGKKVIVVGGGNVAIDAVRVALRLGAREARIVYRRTREEMPALMEEIEDAEKESVTFNFLVSPVKIGGQDGRVTHLECLRNELSEPDSSGRRKPVPVENSNFNINADIIIFATGQQPDLSFLDGTEQVQTDRNRIMVNPNTMETSLPGVFAGGDAVTGPASAIKAMAAGKKAAAAIHAYLRGQEPSAGINYPVKRKSIIPEHISAEQRSKPSQIDSHHLYQAEKRHTFDEIMLAISEPAARAEANRCLHCDLCIACGKCEDACREQIGADALELGYAGSYGSDESVKTDFHRPGEKCIGCGTCSVNCPTGAITLEDKAGYREMRMCGYLMSRLVMVNCKSCGQPFATAKHMEFINEQVNVKEICPDCARNTWSQNVYGSRII
ncbi:FAD-dependent oxidoreductase [Desulfoscipio gibsoniae]|uniref:NADPH-dependent glutamate synthase beta chain-like oxidoreductase n=1 Tax=Desulfoscipio gibsoniae DSM 7213 TaxID=767817 RepID=R4KHM6_9FIRM|nr:FAD-dependent oxidoreductase [Desulfoscipio gibsoniae]AGL01157.1 NADPH-dependent glutamate synthase beta chain-like oxidoreductase [Desulfoscipio gibsoniae DSM 7213]